MPAGGMRSRVAFERIVTVPDGAGGQSAGWGVVYRCRGQYRPERGRERIEAGRMEAAMAGVLRVRSCSQARDLTESDRVLIDGIVFQIRAISNPDGRNKHLELSVERGTGT